MTVFDQKQNEALIRLMTLAKYQDGLLSLLEDDDFAQRVETLQWSSVTAVDLFVNQAVAEVREAIGNSASRRRFITEQCDRFTTTELKHQALEHLEALLEVDGIGDGEETLLHELRQLLTR